MRKLLDSPFNRALITFTLIFLFAACLAWLIKPLLIHVIFSMSLYVLLQPVTGWLIRSGISNSWAALIVLTGLVFISLFSTAIIFPTLLEQFSQLQNEAPKIVTSINQTLENIKSYINEKTGVVLSTGNIANPILNNINEWSKGAIFQISNFAITLIGMAVIVPLLTYFLLKDYRSLRNHMMQFLPNKVFELGWIIYYRVARQIQDYVRGVMIQSGIMASVSTLGFALIGIDLAVLLGIITGLLNIIPYVGPLLAMIPPIIIVMGDVPISFAMVAGAIGVILFAQLIDNVITVPLVIANVVNLHPLVVIMGVIIFGHFFGFIGMIVAIPTLATSKILFTGLIQGLQGKSDNEGWMETRNHKT